MTEELNYLSEKIEDIQQDIDYNTKELAKSKSSEAVQWYSRSIEKAETEKEILNNLLTFVTNNSF
jgi:hypothetical protein